MKIYNKGVGTGDWTAGSCLSRLTVGATFFYRGLENLKIKALKESKGNFNALTEMSSDAKK